MLVVMLVSRLVTHQVRKLRSRMISSFFQTGARDSPPSRMIGPLLGCEIDGVQRRGGVGFVDCGGHE